MKKTIILIAAMLCLTACGKGYSDGSRIGTIAKLSHKGLFCKSWEGQLATNAFTRVCNSTDKNGSCTAYGTTNTFEFSVTDDVILAQLQAAMNTGKAVKLTYDQWLISPPCQQDSSYNITKVEVVQ